MPTIVDSTGSFSNYNSALNNNGVVAFSAFLETGGSGIFTGTDPVVDNVILTGDPLFGSTLANFLCIGGFNDAGQTAFTYSLADGTWGIAIATPIPGPIPCDFNADIVCDITDLNFMLSIGPVASGVLAVGNEQFDLTGDGIINNADVGVWLAEAATENALASPYKLGDANLDGIVDGQDFLLWNAAKFSSSLQWDHGDIHVVFPGENIVIENKR